MQMVAGRWPLGESWTRGITQILETKIPAVFTSFTPRESKKDFSRLSEFKAKFLFEPHLNPFHGGQPRRDPTNFSGVFYDSMFIMGLAGKKPSLIE